MRINLEHLPPHYRKQIRNTIANTPPNVEQDTSNEPLAKESPKRHDPPDGGTYSLSRKEAEVIGFNFEKYFKLIRPKAKKILE